MSLQKKRQSKSQKDETPDSTQESSSLNESVARNSEILNESSIETIAETVAEREKADIYLFNGPIQNESFTRILDVASSQKTADKCILMITTYGGDAEFAYKIARWFQRFYSEFVVFPTSVCASAGTLIAIGATELIMSPFSELGPLDPQLKIRDELGERKSGMVTKSALTTLEKSAFEFWQYFMHQIKLRSYGSITFETSADIAARICSTVYAEMYKQVDPDILGQNERDLAVAYEYGIRLASIESRNISDESIEMLVKGYPSHNFVIDAEETELLFNVTRIPSDEITALTMALGKEALNTSPWIDDLIVKRLATYEPINQTGDIDE